MHNQFINQYQYLASLMLTWLKGKTSLIVIEEWRLSQQHINANSRCVVLDVHPSYRDVMSERPQSANKKIYYKFKRRESQKTKRLLSDEFQADFLFYVHP